MKKIQMNKFIDFINTIYSIVLVPRFHRDLRSLDQAGKPEDLCLRCKSWRRQQVASDKTARSAASHCQRRPRLLICYKQTNRHSGPSSAKLAMQRRGAGFVKFAKRLNKYASHAACIKID